jgi:hypothetical protein
VSVSQQPLGRMHSDCVAVGDVLADVVVGKGTRGVVVESTGDQPVVFRADGGNHPPLPVAHRALLSGGIVGFAQRGRGVVAASHEQVADGDAVSAHPGDGGRFGADGAVVD